MAKKGGLIRSLIQKGATAGGSADWYTPNGLTAVESLTELSTVTAFPSGTRTIPANSLVAGSMAKFYFYVVAEGVAVGETNTVILYIGGIGGDQMTSGNLTDGGGYLCGEITLHVMDIGATGHILKTVCATTYEGIGTPSSGYTSLGISEVDTTSDIDLTIAMTHETNSADSISTLGVCALVPFGFTI